MKCEVCGSTITEPMEIGTVVAVMGVYQGYVAGYKDGIYRVIVPLGKSASVLYFPAETVHFVCSIDINMSSELIKYSEKNKF